MALPANNKDKHFESGLFGYDLKKQILVAAILGVLVGLFFGEDNKFFLPISNAYSMLLTVVVYPYIICTLLANLGRLSPSLSFRLLKSGWLIYLFLIILVFLVLFILVQALPSVTTSLQVETQTTTAPHSLMELLIPNNLFAALANNYVPAVVLFCIIFGIMLQRVKGEQFFFRSLDTISAACVECWHWLIKLAPIGLFATVAYIAGTIHYDQLQEVTEYLILFSIGVILIAFWLLPGLISAITDIPYRRLMQMMKNILIVAVSTKLSILALPFLNTLTQKLLMEEHAQKDTKEITETVLLVGFPLVQLGNFFVYLFIQFASTYFHQPLSQIQNILLPPATYFSSIGSSDTTGNAISFLAAWLHFPVETANLYDSLNLITEYGQVLVSVMGFAFLAILVTFSYYGKLRWQFKKIFSHIIIVGIILALLAAILQHFIPDPSQKLYQRISNFEINRDLVKAVPITILPAFDETKDVPEKSVDTLTRIQTSGVLRVGYNADARPFAFYNDNGRLVGYDVAMMYALAKSLKCSLQFIPYSWPHAINDMLADKFDIAISGLYVTPLRLQYISFTQPYLQLPLSLIVPQNRAGSFANLKSIQNMTNLRLGISSSLVVASLTHEYFPNAQHVIIDNFYEDLNEYFNEKLIDASFTDISRSQMWALGHPGFVAIMPNNFGAPVLMGYMVQKNSMQFLAYLNYWLELQDNNGFNKKLFNKWILGRESEARAERWSVWHNVLKF